MISKNVNLLLTILMMMMIFQKPMTYAACFEDDGFLPFAKNYLIPTSYVNLFNPNLVTEEAFNRISDEVHTIYAPIVKNRGGVLKIIKNWKSEVVNARAQRKGSTYQVTMYGGLARHPLNTADGFALVLCHEIGHHLGGKPLANNWASNEGQSDYFATSKCLRKYFSTQDSAAVVSSMLVPEKVQTQCFKSFGISSDHAICIRNSLAGLTLSHVLDALARSGGTFSWGKSEPPTTNYVKPDFTTPDPAIVKITDSRHPKAQCRLDTYFAGAICQIPSVVDFSYKEEKTGACVNGLSARPACWYASKGN